MRRFQGLGAWRRRDGRATGATERAGGAAAGRSLGELMRDQAGAVLVITAIFSLVMFGFLALATDVGAWYTMQRSMQSAADAGAMGGAYEMAAGQSNAAIETAARDDSGLNGFVHGENGVDVAVTISGKQVEVIVSQQAPMFFAPLFLNGPPMVAARAVAGLDSKTLCLLALDPNGEKALYVDSNAQLTVEGCDIHVNSSHSRAITTLSNSEILGTDGASICVFGGAWGNGNIEPTPQTGCPPRDDPLAGLNVAFPSGGCTGQPKEYDNVTRTISPGHFCEGLTIKGNSSHTVTLSPGTYYIRDKFLVDSNIKVVGNGVTIVLGHGARVEFKSNVVVQLNAPTTGTLAGILFYEHSSNPQNLEHHFDSNNVSSFFNGVIYLPRGKFYSDSNTVIGGTSVCTMLIARRFEFNSNVEFQLRKDPSCPFSFPGEDNKPMLLV